MVFRCLLLICLAGFASRDSLASPTEPDVLSVSAERLDPRWGAQTMQLVIENHREKEKRKATLYASSNFIGLPSENVRLGHFEAHDLRRMENDRHTLVNWHLGLANTPGELAKTGNRQSPAIRAYVGGIYLGPSAPQYSDALTFLERAWELVTWIPVDAVHIRKQAGKDEIVLRYKGKVTLRERKGVKDFNCRKEKSADGNSTALVCAIPRFGTAYLLP